MFLVVTVVAIGLARFNSCRKVWKRLDEILNEFEKQDVNIYIHGSSEMAWLPSALRSPLAGYFGPSSCTRWDTAELQGQSGFVEALSQIYTDELRQNDELKLLTDANYDLLLNFRHIEKVHSNLPVTKHGMEVIASLPALKEFEYVPFFTIPDTIEILGHAPRLTSFRFVNCHGPSISECIRGVGKLRHLRSISLEGRLYPNAPENLSFEAMRELTSLPELRTLKLDLIAVPADYVDMLRQLPRLEKLEFNWESEVPGAKEILKDRPVTITILSPGI
jgi:hypothetical protein